MKPEVRDTIRKKLRTGSYLIDQPLSAYTWYRVGGCADILVFPESVEELRGIVTLCREQGAPMVLLGEGANVLVSDSGFRGVAVNLSKCCAAVIFDDNRVRAGAGVKLRTLICACQRRGLGGVEGLSGIPGTLGGALVMNAGANDVAIERVVRFVDALDGAGEPVRLPHNQIGFSYRQAPGLKGMIVVGAELELTPGNTAALEETRLSLLRRRASKQPLEFPSCGSVFKRPEGYYVGKLVEDSGMKGLRLGDAMVSDKHGGFIVNLGCATADDIRGLIRRVQSEILRRYGVQLECEVHFVGF